MADNVSVIDDTLSNSGWGKTGISNPSLDIDDHVTDGDGGTGMDRQDISATAVFSVTEPSAGAPHSSAGFVIEVDVVANGASDSLDVHVGNGGTWNDQQSESGVGSTTETLILTFANSGDIFVASDPRIKVVASGVDTGMEITEIRLNVPDPAFDHLEIINGHRELVTGTNGTGQLSVVPFFVGGEDGHLVYNAGSIEKWGTSIELASGHVETKEDF